MRKTIKIPLYDQRVIVIVSTDLPNVAARKHKVIVPFERHESKAKAAGVTWNLPNGRIVVYLTPGASLNTCSHEAMHISFNIAERLGFDWDVEELLDPKERKDRAYEELAYLTGYITEQLWKLTRR